MLASFPQLQPLLATLQGELDIAEAYLREALGMDPAWPAFLRIVGEARAELTQQMALESCQLLPIAKTLLDPRQAVIMANRLRALKDGFVEADFMGSYSLRADAGYYG